MTLDDFAIRYIDNVQKGLNCVDLERLEEAATRIRECKGIVWLIGNGGSASLASHMATDLQLAGVRAQALTDVAAITTYANDLEFEACFKSQLLTLSKPGDILIAISGSGNSINIFRPCGWAMGAGIFVIALSGFNGGNMRERCDLHLHAPASHMGQVQDIEQVMLHIICYWLMQERKG